MKACARFLSKQLLALLLCVSVAFAQTTPPVPGPPAFTQQELDQMLAPIALYPDALLSQILMASTYPIEIVQAARWSKANPNLTGDQAVNAVQQYNWDPSVESLVAFPQILAMMDEKLDWTQRLGDAFLSQQQQVMSTVQDLRQKALAAGNLQSNEHVRVEAQGPTIVVEQANPQVVYVPYYNPTVVYGPWWWPAYPPVYWGPWPGYYQSPGFGTGFFWGVGITLGAGFFFGAFDWHQHRVNVVNVNYYYRPPPHITYGPPGSWQHDPGHRRGVPYRDPVLRQEFGRPNARPDARVEYRGNEPYRSQGPGASGSRPDARNVPSGRPEQGERTQPGANGNARPNVPDVGRPEQRSVPVRPSVATAPSRPNVPDVARPEGRSAPMPPTAPIAPGRPNVEPRPHIFEGVGQGAAVRDSSARGHSSAQAMAPANPAARPQGAAPAPRQGGNAPAQRPSGGGPANSAAPHQQQR
jgi:hypothetical protein